MAITTSSSSSILKWILDPKKNFLAAMHKSSVDHRLRKYGLTTYSSFSLSSNLLLQISSPIETQVTMDAKFFSFLKLVGTGYKARAENGGRLLYLKLGYSHEVELTVPPSVRVFYSYINP